MQGLFPDSFFSITQLWSNDDEQFHNHRSLQTAVPDQFIDFWYQEAPDPSVAFALAGFFSVLTLITFTFRLRRVLKDLYFGYYSETAGLTRQIKFRAFLASLNDGDDAMYTIFAQTAMSFWFLGGFQTRYELTYTFMCLFYFSSAIIDLSRFLLAYADYDSLKELVVTTNYYKMKMNDPDDDTTTTKKNSRKKKRNKSIHFSANNASVTINPMNVYQNFAMNGMMVTICFLSQFILFTFVVWDTLKPSQREKCFDFNHRNDDNKPETCAVTQYMFSWWLYVLGIIVQCVYLVGPGNGFGQNHQDPVYWLAVLLATKKGGTMRWTTPAGLGMTGGQESTYRIYKDDWRLWARLFLTTIINGFCFRVLLHSLPLQLASKKIWVTVIRQALGVTYITKLDDAQGYTLVVEEENSNGEKVLDDDDNNNNNKREDRRGVSTKVDKVDLGIGLLLNNVYEEYKDEDDEEFDDDSDEFDDKDDENNDGNNPTVRVKTLKTVEMSTNNNFDDSDDEGEIFC